MEKTTTTFQIETDLHHEFKVELTINNDSMADILRDAIESYVKKSKKKRNEQI